MGTRRARREQRPTTPPPRPASTAMQYPRPRQRHTSSRESSTCAPPQTSPHRAGLDSLLDDVANNRPLEGSPPSSRESTRPGSRESTSPRSRESTPPSSREELCDSIS